MEKIYFMDNINKLFFLGFFLILFSCGKSNKTETFYENGQLKETGILNNGSKDGVWTLYSSNGDTLEKNYYQLGDLIMRERFNEEKIVVLDSFDVVGYDSWTYYKNGRLETERRYENELPVGEYIAYHENGNIQVKGNYLNGKLVGKYEQFYPNGKTQFMSENVGEDIHYVYDSTGNPTYEVRYKNFVPIDTIARY
ncbi:MAG: hypothetical protein ABJH98_15390 [Reichenbachiella sp.]|uniref:toxin-antitoxin system YwqK family antitoxin n=1 Tax=Reichenbachiella sp. TaxID=2184521 RepID=UPI003298B04F